MSSSKLYLALILFAIISGCTDGNKQSTDKLIIVDVTKTDYPKKELILQDFMDVEYVVLETKDDFYNKGFVEAIGEKFILVTNRNGDGDIYIYNKNGKALRKFNHKGQGPEEYISINSGISLDENNNEIFVNDFHRKRIVVYDLYGNFKRSFKDKEGFGSEFYTEVLNYNEDNLICYDAYNEKTGVLLVSKQDGSITKEVEIPFNKKRILEQIMQQADGTWTLVSPGRYKAIIPYKDNWILVEHSSDTVYTLAPDNNLLPFLVRTPPIESMDSEIFLVLRFVSDRHIFMEAIKNTYDFNKYEGFPRHYLVYDRIERTVYNYTVYNGDYSVKKEMYMIAANPVNHKIASWYPLEAHQLVESYQKGELKGKLKEIAATLNEESNPVIILIKHKK
jgi:hypothetical protein